MKLYKNILSANLVKYNANASGKSTEDCVVRSLSLAFDVPYTEVRKELNAIRKETRSDSYKYPNIYSKFIVENGGSSQIKEHRIITLDEFADDMSGTYVVEVKKSANARFTTHAVAVVDHEIYDSWDSSDWYVGAYFKINKTRRPNTNIKDEFDELFAFAKICTDDLIKQFFNKYKLYEYNYSYKISNVMKSKDFMFEVKATLSQPTSASDNGEDFDYLPYYDLDVKYVFTPTTTLDEAKEYIQKNAKQKLYDKFYYINIDIKERIEAYNLKKSAGISKTPISYNGGARAVRFYNSLPTWCKPFVLRVSVDHPGQYHDSYQILLAPLPDDPKKNIFPYNGNKFISFEWYNSAGLKDMLNRYKTSYERPGMDYDPQEEY